MIAQCLYQSDPKNKKARTTFFAANSSTKVILALRGVFPSG